MIEVGSPLAGWVWPLTATPDPAFAEGLLGPGVAIDPVLGEVVSPFDGVIVTLSASRHAVVVRHATGAEILVHVGVDTVALAGMGFEALVTPDEAVRRGQVLIRFDLDAVARAAPSLVSPVLLLGTGEFALESLARDVEVIAGAPLFRLRRVKAAAVEAAPPKAEAIERSVVVALPHGLHVRPAAALARLARELKVGCVMTLSDGRTGDLVSTVALLSLGVASGDRVTLHVSGTKCEAAAEALAALLEGGFAEPAETPAPAVIDTDRSAESAPAGVITGLCGAPGRATGPIHHWAPAQAAANRAAGAPAHEAARLETALSSAASDLTTEAFWSAANPVMAGILQAHLALAEDTELRRRALAEISGGTPAGAAWSSATEAFAAVLEQSGDARLAGRAADLRDVRARVLRALAGDDEGDDPAGHPPPGAILVARDLPPSVLSRLGAIGLAGVCLAESGPTAHVALIASSIGLPMLVSAGPALTGLPTGAIMTLDADAGRLSAAPLGETAAPMSVHRSSLDETEPALTLDGVRVTVLANLGAAEEAARALDLGAEGCGLLRTEFLFMHGEGPPTETTQRESYARVLAELGDRPLIIRTMDIGADKPAPWLPFRREPNPALGRRGIRVGLARPDLLATQLRAIAGLPAEAQVSVMVPMVTTLEELRAVRAALDEACHAVGRSAAPPLGVMVETPAAALMADRLASEADFLSIGTNDLAQYVLAADRMGAGAADAFDPAVLRAIALTIEGAAKHGRPVSVCGGLASDPLGARLLLGFGVRRLSCAPAAIPRVKALMAGWDMEACQALARRALGADSASQVRALARGWAPKALGGE